MRPIDAAIEGFPAIYLNGDQAYYLLRGNPVQAGAAGEPGLIRLYNEDRRFLGIGEVLRDGRLAPKRLFVDGQPQGD